jgi:hypothetical protein
MPNWYIGRTSRFYVAPEAGGYGVAPAFSGSSAMRVSKALLDFDPHKYVPSPQRFTDPSQRALMLGRVAGKFAVDGLWYPSGTLNTLPEQDAFLANGLGVAAQNVVLSTTFTGGGETVTGGTLVSVTGLVIGQMVCVKTGGSYYVRFLKNLVGSVVTLDPPLPSVPINGDNFYAGITYSLGTALPLSLDMASYPHAPAASTPARELLGCVVDKLAFSFDGNREPKFNFSGPAQIFAGSAPNYTPQAEPGAWTTVGSESLIPNGMTLTVTVYDGTTAVVYQVVKLDWTVENKMELQNNASGTSKATAYLRKGKRSVAIKVQSMVSDDKTLWTPSLSADATTTRSVLVQIGNTQGYIWALYAPSAVLMAPPTIPDTDETQTWDFMMSALATAANNEMAVGLF